MSEPVTQDSMVAALLREREELAHRGLADRVAQVDEQLAHRGHTPPADEQRRGEAVTRTTPPRGRRAAQQDKT